ncbi:MAG: NADH-quinone oxidoreductase subunit NuoE [Verrucomicrobia bacterium]|nr:NADH-quinone oxidoreductase subunit NuoE [Verrucomicrobiota bacterium]
MATEAALKTDIDLAPAEALIAAYMDNREATIALLQDVQKHYGYLPRPVLELISERLNLPHTQLFALATFYRAFSLKPRGRHLINVCTGTTCHVRGAPMLLEAIERECKCKAGGTTADGRFTIETVNCVGACALAPVIVIDEEAHGRLTQAKLKKVLDQYK